MYLPVFRVRKEWMVVTAIGETQDLRGHRDRPVDRVSMEGPVAQDLRWVWPLWGGGVTNVCYRVLQVLPEPQDLKVVLAT